MLTVVGGVTSPVGPTAAGAFFVADGVSSSAATSPLDGATAAADSLLGPRLPFFALGGVSAYPAVSAGGDATAAGAETEDSASTTGAAGSAAASLAVFALADFFGALGITQKLLNSLKRR